MKSAVAEILEGKYDSEKAEGRRECFEEGTLEFSCLNLELSLKRGEVQEGSFLIISPSEFPAEGCVLSSEIRMECLDREFIGVREEIRYRFLAEGMEEGEVLEGNFSVLSNYGEYEIPFRAAVKEDTVDSSLGPIKNTFHFANLAKTDWKEAVKIFYSSQFRRIFSHGNDRQYYNAYQCLSAVQGNEQNVEEFLLEIHKKQKVNYIPDRTEICEEAPADTAEYGLTILREGWGYTFLNISADGDFLKVRKKKATDDDFLGNSFSLVFAVEPEKLHSGRNFGAIHIFNSYVDITIPVTVVKETLHRRAMGLRKEKKRLLVQLMQSYESFRIKKISSRIWMKETEKLLERLAVLDEKDVQTRLFGIQLLITQERYKEAKWRMEQIREELDEEACPPEIWCYYLYLTTLCSREASYVDTVAVKVEQAHRANPGNWRIAWLMLYLSEEYNRSQSRRFLILEEQFHISCISPVLYVEAWHLLTLNPTLLMKLEDFEIQVLNFAAKRGLMTPDLEMQISYLASKKKEYSERIFYILKECYEKNPNNDTLQAICTHLIKGSRTDAESFHWYSLSVEQELRITKLYEYYMMSLPEDYKEELPRIVLMYFAYHSELTYKKNAFLYAYVYKRREEQPEIYINYCDKIDRFVMEQIRRGRINEDLAYLYKHVLTPKLVKEEEAKALCDLLFMHRVTVEDKNIRRIVVRYELCREEYAYPVNGKTAWVPLYGSNYKILPEDGEGNRYLASIPCKTQRMLLPGRLLQIVSPYVTQHTGLDIFLCEGEQSLMQISEKNVTRFRNLAVSPQIEEEVQSDIRLRLAHYYYEQDYMRELDSYLEELEPEQMKDKERNEILRFFVARGMYDKAFSWIKSFGVCKAEAKTMVRLCSRLLSRDGFLEDEKMTYAVSYAFRNGKYDANILTYLVYFYNGTIRELRDIWKAAMAFEIETYPLCERILSQLMYTGSFVAEETEIFKCYVSGGARTAVEGAFLSRCSYDYFIKDRVADPFIFTDAVRVYERGEKLQKVCRLAVLKYYSENRPEITPKIRAAVQSFLYGMLEENIYFPFYKEYAKEIPVMEQFLDKTMVEYKVKPGNRAVIHYIIERGRYTESEYKKEEMRDMYGGVCVKAFILFFGENLQYYITEEKEGREQLTKSASVNKSDTLQETDEGKFSMINDIAVAKTLQDYNTADSLLEDYFRKEYMVSQLFRLQ